MTAATDPHLETDHRPEWVGGVVTLPMHIREGGKTYRPSLIVWLDAATEMILGASAVLPQDTLAAAAENLRETAQSPKAGNPVLPGRVRVASPELADALRRGSLHGIEVVVSPTPELDRAIDSLIEHMGANDEEPDLRYLGAGATAEGTAALFRATAALYRARPWNVIPSDDSLIGVTCEMLGLRDAAVSVIGQADQTHGFLLFSSLGDFHQFMDASDRAKRGEPTKYPPHLALTYLHRAEVGPGLLAEIATHRWELADAAAYPVISAIDQDAQDAVVRGPRRDEMLRVEVIAMVLVEIIREDPSDLECVFDGGSPLVARRKLATSAGEVEVEISAPHPGQLAASALFDEDGEFDEKRLEAYRAAILQRFKESPEAQAEPAAHWSVTLVNYAATYFGKTAEALTPAELDEIVFEIIPRKVSVEPEAAPAIVVGLRAFLTFLQREHPGPAGRCLAVLDDKASQRLARLLADPSNFGPAKSFVMSGRAAGFDMSSQAGLGAWAEHMRKNNLRLPVGRPPPSAQRRDTSALSAQRRDTSAQQRAAQQVKKAKRKAQRAARKRSR